MLSNGEPATTSGRIVDLAVDTDNPSTLYLALASQGVQDYGTTFEPIFDGEEVALVVAIDQQIRMSFGLIG